MAGVLDFTAASDAGGIATAFEEVGSAAKKRGEG
jgi:hypothetical protein